MHLEVTVVAGVRLGTGLSWRATSAGCSTAAEARAVSAWRGATGGACVRAAAGRGAAVPAQALMADRGGVDQLSVSFAFVMAKARTELGGCPHHTLARCPLRLLTRHKHEVELRAPSSRSMCESTQYGVYLSGLQTFTSRNQSQNLFLSVLTLERTSSV